MYLRYDRGIYLDFDDGEYLQYPQSNLGGEIDGPEGTYLPDDSTSSNSSSDSSSDAEPDLAGKTAEEIDVLGYWAVNSIDWEDERSDFEQDG
jgi:hypothetical protein